MRHYTIFRATQTPAIDGLLDEPDWAAAPEMGEFHFPWHTAGEKEQTLGKMLWDDCALYLALHCFDRHISASVTEFGGPVWQDDCVELFVAPDPDRVMDYYTFEVNCTGFMLNENYCQWFREAPRKWVPRGVVIGHSLPGPVKEESPDDREWFIELLVPFENFARSARHTPPWDGDVWHLNVQRTGGKTNAQHSAWSNYETERVSFHQPQFFGMVVFSSRPVR